MQNFINLMEQVVLVNKRLVVCVEVTLQELFKLLEELESIECDNATIFQTEAFIRYNKISGCMADHVLKLPLGESCGYDGNKIKKISEHLCVFESRTQKIPVEKLQTCFIAEEKGNLQEKVESKIQLCG